MSILSKFVNVFPSYSLFNAIQVTCMEIFDQQIEVQARPIDCKSTLHTLKMKDDTMSLDSFFGKIKGLYRRQKLIKWNQVQD